MPTKEGGRGHRAGEVRKPEPHPALRPAERQRKCKKGRTADPEEALVKVTRVHNPANLKLVHP